MDHVTLGLAVIAALSEILPLLGFTKANGLLHTLQLALRHIHGKSVCNVTLETT